MYFLMDDRVLPSQRMRVQRDSPEPKLVIFTARVFAFSYQRMAYLRELNAYLVRPSGHRGYLDNAK